MKLGEVRVDRTSVLYLVHAVRGGGPVGWLTAFGEGERPGAHHVRGRGTVRSSPSSGSGNTVRSSPRLCLMLGTVGLGVTQPLADRAENVSRAGRPTPCPLSLAAGRRPPQSGKGKNPKAKITSPQGIVPALGWIVSAGLRRKSQWRGRPGLWVPSPFPHPRHPVLPPVGTAEGAGERRDRARPL